MGNFKVKAIVCIEDLCKETQAIEELLICTITINQKA